MNNKHFLDDADKARIYNELVTNNPSDVNIIEFKQIQFTTIKRDSYYAIRAVIHYKNGYNASLARSIYTHGGKEGLYEMGILKGDDLCDPLNWLENEDVGDKVRGWLSEDDVLKELKLIEALPDDE